MFLFFLPRQQEFSGESPTELHSCYGIEMNHETPTPHHKSNQGCWVGCFSDPVLKDRIRKGCNEILCNARIFTPKGLGPGLPTWSFPYMKRKMMYNMKKKKQTLLLTCSFAHTCHCPPITLFQFLESLEQKPANITQRCSCGPCRSGLLDRPSLSAKGQPYWR